MEPPSGFEHVTPGLKSTDRIWFDKILKKYESKRSKGYFSREFFQRAFLSESSFPSGFFFGRLDVLVFPLEDAKLSFQEIIIQLFLQ